METWLPIAISCIMAIVAIITLSRNGKKETSDIAAERASLSADVKYIRGSIDEMKLDNRVMQKDVSDLKIKVVEIEQSVKHAHERLDKKGA
jgi:hypothetical protein